MHIINNKIPIENVLFWFICDTEWRNMLFKNKKKRVESSSNKQFFVPLSRNKRRVSVVSFMFSSSSSSLAFMFEFIYRNE